MRILCVDSVGLNRRVLCQSNDARPAVAIAARRLHFAQRHTMSKAERQYANAKNACMVRYVDLVPGKSDAAFIL
jgi:hypothetical protein